jgi:magnesium transporter
LSSPRSLNGGSAPATSEEQVERSAPVSFLYDAERRDRHVAVADVAVDQLNAEQLLWIDVSDEEGIADVAAALGLAGETVQAIREASADPALFVHEAYVHVVVLTPETDTMLHSGRALHCVVGPNWMLTAHRHEVEFLGRFDERIRGDSALGRLDGHGFLAAILQEHVASYLVELRPIEAELDKIDLRSMTGRIDEDALLHELVRTRLRLSRLRRMLEPHRELFTLLARSEFSVLSGSQAASDFERLSELLESALQSMEATREMIIGSFEIYTTWTAHATNKVIKMLTVVSVALLPPTLLAGVMGMNSLPRVFVTGTAFWVSALLIAALPVSVLTAARLKRLL